MSYDVTLKDINGNVIQLPIKHIMTGGTYVADFDKDTGEVSPMPIADAWLNITYNYSKYYYDATVNDDRFAHDEISCHYADGTDGPIVTEYGLKGIDGKTGAESIAMLTDMIIRIVSKYKKNGKWISTDREITKYIDKSGVVLSISDILANIGKLDRYDKIIENITIDEGSTSEYWTATAANAIIPLAQLITMAKLRPDGIWDVE